MDGDGDNVDVSVPVVVLSRGAWATALKMP